MYVFGKVEQYWGKLSSTGYLFVCAMLFRYMTLALCLRFVRKGVWLVQISMGLC